MSDETEDVHVSVGVSGALSPETQNNYSGYDNSGLLWDPKDPLPGHDNSEIYTDANGDQRYNVDDSLVVGFRNASDHALPERVDVTPTPTEDSE